MTGWQTPEPVDMAHAAVNEAVHDLCRAWREHAMMIAVDRDTWRTKATRYADLLTAARALTSAITADANAVDTEEVFDLARDLDARLRAL